MVDGKKEIIYAVVFNILSKFVTYGLLLVFANLYLIEEFGKGNFVFNIRGLIMLFTFFGIPGSIIPFIVKKEKLSSIFKATFTINLIALVIGLIFSIYYLWILPLVLTLPIVLLNSFAISFWRAKSRYDVPNKIGFFTIIVVLVFAILLKDYGKLGIVSAYALGNVFSCLLAVYPIRSEMYKSLIGKGKIKESSSFLKLGITVAFIGGLFVLMNWINSTLLGIVGTFEQVAQFGIASSLAGVLAIIPSVLSMFIITRASQVKAKIMSKSILHRVVRISFFSTLMIAILITILINPIIAIFFPAYIGTEFLVSLLLIGMVFYSSYFIIYSYYIGKRDAKKAIVPVSIGVGVSTILSIILIPIYGVLGVALSIILANFAILLFIARAENIKRIILISILAPIAILLTYYIGYFGIIILISTVPISIFLKIIYREDLRVIINTISKILKR